MFDWKKITLGFGWNCFSLFASTTLAGFFSQYDILCELCSYFCVQYAIVFGFLAILFGVCRSRNGIVASLALAAINLMLFLPLSFGEPLAQRRLQAEQDSIKLVYMNVNYGNNQYNYAVNFIQDSHPEMFAVSECTNAWAEQLAAALPEYKFNTIMSRPDAFGIALFSRIPLTKTDVVYWGRANLPSIVARLNYHGTPVTILATHPLPPLSSEGFVLRNEQLSLTADEARKFDSSLIVLGDFNATGRSYWFQEFRKRLNLHDTRDGFGVLQSWPVGPVPSFWNLIWVTLDHVLVSGDWVTLNRSVGPSIASDHLPVFVELSLRKASQNQSK